MAVSEKDIQTFIYIQWKHGILLACQFCFNISLYFCRDHPASVSTKVKDKYCASET